MTIFRFAYLVSDETATEVHASGEFSLDSPWFARVLPQHLQSMVIDESLGWLSKPGRVLEDYRWDDSLRVLVSMNDTEWLSYSSRLDSWQRVDVADAQLIAAHVKAVA